MKDYMVAMNDIILAIKGLLTGRFPGHAVYMNLLAKNFTRPSFLIELANITRSNVCYGTVAVAASFSITCYVEIDGQYNSDVERLIASQNEAMELFTAGYIEVEERRLEV